MIDPHDKTVASASDSTATAPDEAYCSACNQSFPLDRDTCPNDGARLVKLKAAHDVLVGRVFDGRYELRASLGHGGMGTVYRAYQISVDREVAIKVIHPKLASDRVSVKRFLREARLASRLAQPNIVNVYDFGQTDDGILYLVMEMLAGRTLAKELDLKRALPLKRVATIALQLCDALEVAHSAGIVHRDLKPSNIVVLDDPPGRDLIKVLDFGLAKSLVSDTTSLTTNSDAILGTPLYMPPEQIEGRPSDARADLYSLGCILHHMLAGTPPFVRETVNLVLSAHLHDAPPPLPATVPPRLVQLIARLTAKDVAQRPASASEVRAVFQESDAAGETAIGTESQSGKALERSSTDPIAFAMTDPGATKRPRRRAWLAVLPLVALAGAGGWWFFGRADHEIERHDVAPPHPVQAPVDARPADAAPADAAPPIDAPLPPPADAGAHRPRPARDAGAHGLPDAAGRPSIDFYPN